MEDEWGSFATAGKKKKGKKGKVAEPEPVPEPEPEPVAEPEPEPAPAAPEAAADDMWGFSTTSKKKKGKKGKVSHVSFIRVSCGESSRIAVSPPDGAIIRAAPRVSGQGWVAELVLRITLHTASNPIVSQCARGAHATPPVCLAH